LSERARENKTRTRLKDPQKRYWIYMYLVERDGPNCLLCGVSHREKELVIDHADGNPENWAAENLRLLCKSCNEKERWRQIREAMQRAHGVIAATSPVRESERARLARVDGERGSNLVAQQDGSVELRLNREKEPWYRGWLMGRLLVEGSVSVDEALHAGAEKVGVSPLTARRYLKKLTSVEGPLIVVDCGPAGSQVRVKPEYWERLAPAKESGGTLRP